MKKLRLTESDLRNLISSSVRKIIKESLDNNSILSEIVDSLGHIRQIDAKAGDNYIEAPLDDEGNLVAVIDYFIEDERYLMHGAKSHDYDVPDDPDEMFGDFNVNVTSIIIEENGEEVDRLEDNGMVADALKSLVELDNERLEYYEPEYDYEA